MKAMGRKRSAPPGNVPVYMKGQLLSPAHSWEEAEENPNGAHGTISNSDWISKHLIITPDSILEVFSNIIIGWFCSKLSKLVVSLLWEPHPHLGASQSQHTLRWRSPQLGCDLGWADTATGAIAGYELGFHRIMASLRLEKASKTIMTIQPLAHCCQGHHQSVSPSDIPTCHLYTSRNGGSSTALGMLLHCLTVFS